MTGLQPKQKIQSVFVKMHRPRKPSSLTSSWNWAQLHIKWREHKTFTASDYLTVYLPYLVVLHSRLTVYLPVLRNRSEDKEANDLKQSEVLLLMYPKRGTSSLLKLIKFIKHNENDSSCFPIKSLENYLLNLEKLPDYQPGWNEQHGSLPRTLAQEFQE